MIKILAYPLSAIYFLFFGLTLLIFHPIQWICFNVFGYQAHKKSVDYLNLCLVRYLHLLGTRVSFKNSHALSKDTPIIIVANHQSMSDIPSIIWFMRKYHAKFISKKELGKGIPSVSYNLRNGGSVLIDRKKPFQAFDAIKQMASYIELHKRAVVIFPEGTRSRDGEPKRFKTKGLKVLIEHSPNALILPVTINNSWKTLRYGKFPLGIGAHIKFNVHSPLAVKEFTSENLIELVEKQITEAITYD
jgi:1-acyl-sn-glycerol-3-phosphate acyltransferase